MNISSELGDTVRPVLSPKKVSEKIKWILPFVISLLPTLIIAVLSILSLPVLNEVNLKIYDYFLLSSRLPASAHAPLIVDIDEQSLEEYGQWPWPRFLIAELLKKIRQGDPLAVGVDIMFSEPDRTSLTQVYKKLAQHFDIKIPHAENIPDSLQDNDALLTDVLRQGNFITSFYFSSDGRVSDHNCIARPLNIIIYQDSGKNSQEHEALGQANGVVCNLPLFDKAVAVNGFLNVEADSDGILRRVPLLMKYQDEIYPHLSLATLITAVKPEKILFRTSRYGISGLFLDQQFIPLDEQGNLAVHFRAPVGSSARAFEYISAADLLNGKTPPEKLTKKIIFLGTSAIGLNDIHHMPGDYAFPGVEFHADIVDNILSGKVLRSPQWAAGTELLVIILSGLAVAVLFFRLGAKGALLTFICSGTGIFYGSKFLFSSLDIFLSPLYPILLLFFNFIVISPMKMYGYERNRRKKEKEIHCMQESILEVITALTEARDQETGGHIRRTKQYIQIIAEELRKSEKYENILTSEEIEAICKVAPLHDVGKIAIPDNILLKTSRLNAKEFEEIKKHTSYGKEIIETALEQSGRNYFLEKALEIVYTHQEKWDGSGYPQALSGENIPLSGRIMAIADVYDALTSTRPYKVPVEHEKAVAIMQADSGTHFDPELIKVFLKVHERFREISMRYASRNKLKDTSIIPR